MTLRFDHAVILVNDLNAAISDYRSMGFNAFFGGEHAGGKTHNALIVFEDGGYLELLAPTNSGLLKTVDANDRSSFLFMFQYGEGFGGYALLSQDLEADTEAMRRRGLDVQPRPPGGRARPDGQQLRWRSALSGGSMTPFFIQDDTPRGLRVPSEAEKTHQPNGVTGVSGLAVAVENLVSGINRYQAIFDIQPENTTDQTAEFRIGNFMVTLEQSRVTADKLIALRLRANEHKILNHALTHQASIELVAS